MYNDGSGIFNVNNVDLYEKITLIDINEFILSNKIENIDLMKINIEGCEYELLEALIEKGNINKIRNLQIQFHPSIKNATVWREKIRNKLKETHIETYNYPFIWENWEIKV